MAKHIPISFGTLALSIGLFYGEFCEGSPWRMYWIAQAIFGIWSIGFLFVLPVLVRRFHDINLTGWFVAFFGVLFCIPLVNLVALLVCIGMLLREGSPSVNDYGDSPEINVYKE